jgi:tetratricopeptide (TPR) repeat protein
MTGITLAAMVLVAAVSTAQAPTGPAADAIEQLYAEGMRLYSRGELGRAVELLETSCARYPEAGRLRYLLALAYRDSMPSRPDEAATELKRALELDPSLPHAASTLADILVRAGRGEEARQMLHRWVQVHPEDASAQWTLGTFLVSDQRWDEGISLLERAVKLAPDHAGAWLALGRSYVRTGKPENAVRPLERARALAPQSAPVRYNLAQAYRATGQMDAAAKELEVYQELNAARHEKEQEMGREDRLHRAVSLNEESVTQAPGGSVARYSNLAALYKEGDTVDRGREFLAGLAAAHPELPAPRVGQALLEHAVGNDGLAMKFLGKALALQPTYGPALGVLPELDPGEGRAERADLWLRAAEGREDAPALLPFWRGLLALRNNRLEAAGLQLQRALENAPDDPDVLLNLGVLYGRTGRLEQARATFQTLVEQTPEDGEAWYNLAFTEMQMGLREPAFEHVQKAHATGEKRPAVLNLLAQLLIERGEQQQARPLLEESLAQNPDQPAVHRALETLGKDAGS